MKQFFLYLLLITISFPAWGSETWQLTVLHTNDVHGALLPFDYAGDPAHGQPSLTSVGGLARRATAISRIRKNTAHTLVLVDAGDVAMRGPWATQFHGVPDIEAMNLMRYDMLCVGNHEFRATLGVDSQQQMLGLVKRSRFPWLAANLTVKTTGALVEGIHPFVVRTFGHIRVGFLGLTTDVARDYPQVKGWLISDPLAAAKHWVPLARKECDILIAITHLGIALDKRLAAEVPGIDAIIGGHSHTFLPNPLIIHGPSGQQVPIVQAGEYGVMLGRLDLTFTREDSWRLKEAKGRLIRIDNTFPEDPAVKSLLEHYLQ